MLPWSHNDDQPLGFLLAWWKTSVLYKYGQQTAEQLQKLGANVGFKVYAEMGHSVRAFVPVCSRAFLMLKCQAQVS
eukprot:scaffold181187_cov18-Tisochrysis_lutea.AAC.1